MLTVRNNLPSHLVIPRGTGTGEALKLAPRGTAEVETLTAPLRDAERNGLVTLGEMKPEPPDAEPNSVGGPSAPEKGSAPTGKGTAIEPNAGTEADGGEALLPQILALVAEGKSQRDIGLALGVNRNVVQRALRQHRQSGRGTEE